MNTAFARSLDIQRRVIGALLMREIITRYGRNNFGYMWLFFDPLMFTTIILLLWKNFRADQISNLPIVPFIITGYPLLMLWRNSSRRCVNAVRANLGLMYHRNVRVLDIFVSRVILELVGCTIAFIIIFIVLYIVGWVEAPQNILLMSEAWLLMSWFALGLGLVVGVVSERFEWFSQLWRTMLILLMPISGALVFVEHLPVKARELSLWIPMVHATEMFRHGYFGDYIRTHEDPQYLMVVNLILLFVGLVLVKKYSRGVEPE